VLFWVCSDSDTIATGEACDCSGNLCTDAEFCYDGTCKSNGVCSVSGTVATGVACYCSENLCTDAQFCYEEVCNTNAQGTLSWHCFSIFLRIFFGK